MAEVPREAVEFARVLVRAFYPPEFVVLTEAVLRHNNYVAHHDLARRLRMQPKELRQTLVRMAHARLMRSEKRQQKRINLRDERRPTRTINTEFWYVPLAELIDAFVYRVHVIGKSIEEKRNNELAQQKYMCTRCRSEYQLLDILSEMTPEGEFVCTKMGVRPDRRPLPCGGLIKEQDNSAQVKETERLRQLIDEELRNLRERAQACASLDIPAHPLEGADEETWGERVPETVGVNGERVDEEGLSSDVKGDGDGPSLEAPIIIEPAGQNDAAPIPEKPSWFREGNKDEEEEWNETEHHILESKTGTAACFPKEEDEKMYLARYEEELARVTPDQAKANASASASVGAAAPVEVIELDNDDRKEETKKRVEQLELADERDDVMVSVAGQQIKLSEVTEDITERMTSEEYKAYFALANQKGGDNLDDDDDEFE